MNLHTLKNNRVEVGVSENCGHLYPVRFFISDKVIEPMHVAPWADEPADPALPPMLQYLRGDFFCAPFGACDVLDNENRAHGASANDFWKPESVSGSAMKFILQKKISGAELRKEISIRDDESVLYQNHIFRGGAGEIPAGHHAMLKVKEKAFLSFSEFDLGLTPPAPVETDPKAGRSVLKYPQQFSSLKKVELAEGRYTDVSEYPFEESHEDLYMLISRRSNPFAWSALSCPTEGYVWFSLKNPAVLPNTVIWLSNGGRYYPPFASRHKKVIGIEETASYFHLGHRASIEANELNSAGRKTFIELSPAGEVRIPYIFGIAEIPPDFGTVATIIEAPGGVEISDFSDTRVNVKLDLKFLKVI